MKKLILIILLAIYSQANWLEEPINENWKSSTDTKFKYFVGLQLADVASTYYALHNGGVEGNSFYGKHPKVGHLLLAKAVVIPLMYYTIENVSTSTADTFLDVMNVLFIGVVGNNVMVGMDIKF